MHRLLVPVDGSENALRAVGYAITVAKERPNTEIHLLHVQEPIPSHVHAYFSAADIEKMGAGETEKTLQPAKQLCADAVLSCTTHSRTGLIAQTIADSADELECNVIVMGTRGMSPIANLIVGSVTAKVLHLANVPILVMK